MGVVKKFRRFDPDQILLMPPSLDEWLPQDHLARFVAELVDEVLDLSAIYADYTEVRGFPPYDPRLMVRLLIYGYTTGVRSSRAIERKCVDDVAFRFFGQIMTCQDGRHLLLRGQNGARAEWRLLAACHNLRKVFGHIGLTGLTRLAT